MDIAPASSSVLRGDFLALNLLEHSALSDDVIVTTPENGGEFGAHNVLKGLRKESFDVVVFSMVLTYMPSPRQRYL
jgi:hypothetical protein